MNLIIDRNLWLRGEGANASALLRESDGKMCCLGFYGLACGIPANVLKNKKQPNDTDVAWPEWILKSYTSDIDKKIHIGCSSACADAMAYNDGNAISDVRERKIAEIFSQHGVEVEFVG